MRNFDVDSTATMPGMAPIKMFTRGVDVEFDALQQTRNVASMPFVRGVALMPDVHWGMGATVGSVIATRRAVIPAAVGVDIGCGMMAHKTRLSASDLPDNLFEIRSAIEAAVPHGRTDNGGMGDKGAFHDRREFSFEETALMTELRTKVVPRAPGLERASKRADYHLGTLGTGNHFIELCVDEDQDVWVMLHSGSRGIGNAIGTYYIDKAKEECERWHIKLPDNNLAYLPQGTQLFDEYCLAVAWAQEFAKLNRERMMFETLRAIAGVMKRPVDGHEIDAVNCHHNYVSWENHGGENVVLTRKGAVRAREGDLGIIPGSMGAKSFIVRGKGNADSYHSCSHGAGRKMSRSAAKKQFTLADHEAATAGVECRKDIDVIDETPGAYKDIDAVMAAQSDLVDIVHTLKQVVCVKG